MSPQDEPNDDLLKRYEQASANQAAGPSDATRRAILSEAAAQARRRTPAANDARYIWRAAAGVAVFGIAVLLWRQANLPTAPVTPTALVAPTAPAGAPADAVSAAPEMAATESTADAVQGAVNPAAAAPPAAAASTRAKSVERSFEQAAMQDAAVAQVEERAAPRALSAGIDLLQEYFPQFMDSPTPRSVWVVLDGDGEMQRSGELLPPQSLDDIAPGPWERSTRTNAQGQRIDIAIYRMSNR
jgi:hypothetical protein